MVFGLIYCKGDGWGIALRFTAADYLGMVGSIHVDQEIEIDRDVISNLSIWRLKSVYARRSDLNLTDA